MNANELAKKMLEWGEKNSELLAIEAEIEKAVLEIGKTYTVGNIRATYSAGRETRDYDAVKDQVPAEVAEKYSTVSVSWAKACEELGIEAPIKSKGNPTVTVKLLKD